MSETMKPQEPPQPGQPGESPPPPPTAAEPASPTAKESVGQQYKKVWQARTQFRDKPTGQAKPEPKPAAPPSLSPEQVYAAGGSAPKLRDLDAEIEKEFQEMMGGLSDRELYGEPAAAQRKPEPGVDQGRKKARVVAIHGPDVFLDVPGGRSQGVLPMTQFPDGPPALGSEVEVHIEGYDGANGLVLLSRQGAAVQADWSSVAPGMIVEARVTSTNKGGLAVDVNGIRGFMPVSQVDLYRVDDLEQFVNQRLRCMVAEVNPEERNLVVSRRALQEKEREESREKLWQELAEGQTREGIVRSIKDFGAFVDLGGVDGLLHVSEMSWSRIQNPADVVKIGEKVKVIVLKIDHERRKLSLGLKQLLPSPWDAIEANYPEGSTVKGKVTRLMDFGAFVELEPGLEGLVHISELAPHRVRKVADVVQVGQDVQVMVLGIDRAQKRIALSLKATAPKDAEEADAEEEAIEDPRPPRPRTTPLRGGIGSQ